MNTSWLYYTMCSWFFQPKPKGPWTFSLLYYRYIKDRSESVEKNVCHKVSKTIILEKRIFCTKTCSLMAFFRQVYRYKFWKPDDRWFFQLNLICLMYNCNIRVKKSMDFFVWVEKPRSALWLSYFWFWPTF